MIKREAATPCKNDKNEMQIRGTWSVKNYYYVNTYAIFGFDN